MNEADMLEAARRAQQSAIAETVAQGQLQVPAPRREPPSDMPVTRADILRLADVLSLMRDLHNEIDERLARLEQMACRRR